MQYIYLLGAVVIFLFKIHLKVYCTIFLLFSNSYKLLSSTKTKLVLWDNQTKKQLLKLELNFSVHATNGSGFFFVCKNSLLGRMILTSRL